MRMTIPIIAVLMSSATIASGDDCWTIPEPSSCVEEIYCSSWCEPCSNTVGERISYPVQKCVLAQPGQGGRAGCRDRTVQGEGDTNLCEIQYYCAVGTLVCPTDPNKKQCVRGPLFFANNIPKKELFGPVCFVDEG